MTRSLEDFADDKASAKFVENQDIARKNRVLTAALRARDEELAEVKRRLEFFEKFDEVKPEPPQWLAPPKKEQGSHEAIPSLFLTDLHWGENVNPAEISGINKYNPKIAGMRVRRAAEGCVKLGRDYLSGVSFRGVNVMLGGDFMSGEIHEELRETNVETIMESILGASEAVIAALRMLADFYGSVHVETTVGNHGRTTRKPRSKKRTKDNYDWLAYKMIERELAGDTRITMNVSESADAYFKIYNTRYCLTHGDQFKGGSGISGMLAPLMLGVHRKTRRDSASKNPWDVIVMGHFHYAYFLRDLIVGGSIVGYNEHAFTSNFPIDPPQAAMWLNTPEHGVTTYCPVYVQDRKKEGW
jgi:hypothetical protein